MFRRRLDAVSYGLRKTARVIPCALAFSTLGACGASADADPPSVDGPSNVDDGGTMAPGANPPATNEPTSPDAGPLPPPLGGELGKWTWVDVPGAICGNGEPTGVGLNAGTGSDLFIFLMGGGGCWDEVTCSAVGTANAVKDGYTKEKFLTELGTLQKGLVEGGILDRTLPNHPYPNASMIFVPYCTGDVHSGDATQQWLLPKRTMHYAGRKNIEALLATLVPAFKNVSRVTFAGSSAGGFGAAINYWRVAQAFAGVRVDLFDDSGPPFEQSKMPLLGTWKKAWNMDGALPPDCAECKDFAEVPGASLTRVHVWYTLPK